MRGMNPATHIVWQSRYAFISLSLSLLIILKLMDNIKIVSNKCVFEICKVPGERVVGSYVLDDLKEYVPVHLQSTAEVHLCTFIFMF